MDIELTCPLGSVCEEIKGDKIHRCRWFTRVEGMNPNTGKAENREECAIAWLPILTIENANTNRGQTAALESFRNEVTRGNNTLLTMIGNAASGSQEKYALSD